MTNGNFRLPLLWVARTGSASSKNLLGRSEIRYTHIYRELNKEADPLSKKALLKTKGKIEYNLWVDGNEVPTLYLNLF